MKQANFYQKTTMNRKEAFEALKQGHYIYNVKNPNCIYHINVVNQPGGKIVIQYLHSDKYEFFQPKHYWLRGNPNDEFKIFN